MFFWEYNVECEVTYLSFKRCPMMPFGFTTFFAFTIRRLFHRTSSCVHTLTNHICTWLWAGNNNSVWLLFLQISFPLTRHTIVTGTCRRPYKTRKNWPLCSYVGWHQHSQPCAEKSAQCAKMSIAVTGQKTCILRKDEKCDATRRHWAGKG
jgi:hypothetical protein